MYDDTMREAFKENKQSIVGFLLMASWLYYNRPHMRPILSDTTFDKACKWLYDNFDAVDHKYKHLITRDDLRAGSLYSLKGYDYPQMIIHLAELLSQGDDSFLDYSSSSS